MPQAAAAARSERQDLEQEQQKQQKLEEQKQKRLEQLKGSTPEAMQIMREAMGDSAGQFMIASHGQVLPSCRGLRLWGPWNALADLSFGQYMIASHV